MAAEAFWRPGDGRDDCWILCWQGGFPDNYGVSYRLRYIPSQFIHRPDHTELLRSDRSGFGWPKLRGRQHRDEMDGSGVRRGVAGSGDAATSVCLRRIEKHRFLSNQFNSNYTMFATV